MRRSPRHRRNVEQPMEAVERGGCRLHALRIIGGAVELEAFADSCKPVDRLISCRLA